MHPTLSRLRLLLDAHHEAHGCPSPCGVCLALEEIGRGEGVQAPQPEPGRCHVPGCSAVVMQRSIWRGPGPYCTAHEATIGYAAWVFCGEPGCPRWIPHRGASRCSLHGGRDYIPAATRPTPDARALLGVAIHGAARGARFPVADERGRVEHYIAEEEIRTNDRIEAGDGLYTARRRCERHTCTVPGCGEVPARPGVVGVCERHQPHRIPSVAHPVAPARPPSPNAPAVPGAPGNAITTHGAPAGVSAEEMAAALRGEGEGLDGAQEPARLTVGVDLAPEPSRSTVRFRRPYSSSFAYVTREEADAFWASVAASPEPTPEQTAAHLAEMEAP
jgi:hypothetical protein